MLALRQLWEEFWFTPASPFNLGCCRMLFLGGLLLTYLPHDFSAWRGVSTVFWIPIPLFWILHVPVLAPGVLTAVQVTWKAALAFGCLGLLTRLSTVTAFVLGIYLIGLPHNFGHTSHHNALLVLILGILALARCGDAWSLDRRIGIFANGVRHAPASGEYTWAIRLVWVLTVIVFFAAGVSKLRYGGLDWATTPNFSLLLTEGYYHTANADPLTPLGLWVARSAWLCGLLSWGTLILELGAPVALFSSRLRIVIVPSLFLMLIAIRALMGPTFLQLLPCAVFWVPWERLRALTLLRRQPSGSGARGWYRRPRVQK